MSEHSEHYHDADRNKPLPGAPVSSKEEVLQTLLDAARGENVALAEANKLLAAQVAGNLPADSLNFLCSTMDAQIWATEFCKFNKASDHEMMLGWFANAIMAGFDEANRRIAKVSTCAITAHGAGEPTEREMAIAQAVLDAALFSVVEDDLIADKNRLRRMKLAEIIKSVSARAADAPSEPSELTDEKIEKIRAKVLLHDIDHNGKRSPDYEQKFARAIEHAVKSRAADAPSEPSEIVLRLRNIVAEDVTPYFCVNVPKDLLRSAADALDSQPTAPTITPSLIATIQDMLIWPVTEDDARTARDLLQEMHFDLSMASSQPTDGEVRNGSDDLHAVYHFLMGESLLEGVKFGAAHPTKAGIFWWRLNLRAAMAKG